VQTYGSVSSIAVVEAVVEAVAVAVAAVAVAVAVAVALAVVLWYIVIEIDLLCFALLLVFFFLFK
jgi:hypothetical protein